MNICFVVNQNYLGQLKVSLFSLALNLSRSEELHVYLLQSDLSDDDKNDLSAFSKKVGAVIDFITMDDSLFQGLPKMQSDSAYTAYFKVMIPYVLSFLDKVLFLDCDLIVEKDLTGLYNFESKTLISACVDKKMNKKRPGHIKKVTGFDSTAYFNSGVMLFNFKYKDEIVSKEELINYVRDSQDAIVYHDQDILNHFYINKNTVLPDKYNYLAIYQSFKDVFFHGDMKRAYILHYANGNWKPWFSNYIGKGYKRYVYYYNAIKESENLSFLKKRSFLDQVKLIFKYVKKGRRAQ